MMSTSRLRELYKQEQNHRKFACVRNEMVKTCQDQFESYIDREKQESVQKNDKAIVFTRKHVVRQHVLTKCMKNKRDEIERKNASKLYGKYNGVGIEEIAGGIDAYLERNHPRMRRKKKIEELFNKGYRKGEILDSSTMHNKVEQYFEKPLVEIYVEPEHDGSEQRSDIKEENNSVLPPISNTFYTGNIQSEKLIDSGKDQMEYHGNTEKRSIKEKVSRYLTEDIPDDASMHSDVTGSPQMRTTRAIRPITLPPVRTGTDNSTDDRKPRPATDSIADIISRINYAKERREREAKIKKEKRQRRILAEKVHGINQGDGIGTDGDKESESEIEANIKTVQSSRGVGFLNLTVPVLSKSKKIKSKYQRSDAHYKHDAGGEITKNSYEKHAHSETGVDLTNNDVKYSRNETGDDKKTSGVRGGKHEGRLILPPLVLKRRSTCEKD